VPSIVVEIIVFQLERVVAIWDPEINVRDTITQNYGFVVKEQGDGFIAAFSSSRNAIISAIAIQKSLSELRNNEEILNIHIRIGINTAEATIENSDHFGRAVNEAARISAEADSEEVLVSGVSKRMADSAGDIEFGEPKELELKRLFGTHLVYPVNWRSKPEEEKTVE